MAVSITEVFANFPATTVPAGANPVSGTDTWIVSSSDGFPTASTGVTQFHVADTNQAAASELILVTNMSGTGNNTWTVTRGAEGTTPVAHEPGFTVTTVITAGWLNDVQGASLPAASAGALLYGNPAADAAWLAGNTTGTKEFLTSTGAGGTANTPAWGTITASDVPVLNQNTTGTAATATLAGNVTGTVAVTNGGTGGTAITAYAVVTGGTASTTPLQTVSGTGTTGQALTSNGAGARPTWQNTLITSGGTVSGNLSVTGTTYVGGGQVIFLAPSGDSSGSTDSLNIQTALNLGAVWLILGEGNFQINQPVYTTASNTHISGAGPFATSLSQAASFSGTPFIGTCATLFVNNSDCTVDNFTFSAFSGTIANNNPANGLEVLAFQTTCRNLGFRRINGWAIEHLDINSAGTAAGNSQCLYDRIFSNGNCAGGMHVSQIGGSSTMGSTIINSGLSCGVTSGAAINNGDALLMEQANDMLITNWQGNVAAGTGSCIHIKGGAPGVADHMDIATNNAVGGPCILIEDSGSSHTTGWLFSNIKIVGGAPPVSLNGNCNDISFVNCKFDGGGADNVDVSTAGNNISFTRCEFGVAAGSAGQGETGTNYDLNWTGTGTGTVIGCNFGSAIVSTGSVGAQYSVNITAGQAVDFTDCKFTGSGASSANWFTNTPAAAMLSSGSGYDFLGEVTVGGTLTTVTPLAVTTGGTGGSTATAYALVTGGTAATSPFQTVSGVGTSNQLLTSNGGGALPSWQTPAYSPWTPANSSLVVANFDSMSATSTFTLSAGNLYLARVPISSALTWTNVILIPNIAGTGTSTGSYVGLYNAANGNLLSQSADCGTIFTAGTNWMTIPLGTAQTLSAGSAVLVGVLCNLSSSQVGLYKSSATSQVANVGLSQSAPSAGFLYRASHYSTTGLGTLPTMLTQSNCTSNGEEAFWAGGS